MAQPINPGETRQSNDRLGKSWHDIGLTFQAVHNLHGAPQQLPLLHPRTLQSPKSIIKN